MTVSASTVVLLDVDNTLPETSGYLIEYPVAERLYPGALDTVRCLNELAQTVILSDGDVVLQPRKIHRSSLWPAVDGDVLVYVHKERELDDVERRYPAEHYVIVDGRCFGMCVEWQRVALRRDLVDR